MLSILGKSIVLWKALDKTQLKRSRVHFQALSPVQTTAMQIEQAHEFKICLCRLFSLLLSF